METIVAIELFSLLRDYAQAHINITNSGKTIGGERVCQRKPPSQREINSREEKVISFSRSNDKNIVSRKKKKNHTCLKTSSGSMSQVFILSRCYITSLVEYIVNILPWYTTAVVRTKFDSYVFITITGLIPLLVDYQFPRVSTAHVPVVCASA